MGKTWRRAARAVGRPDADWSLPESKVPTTDAGNEPTESPPRIPGRAEDVTDELERELREVRPRLARTILALLAGTIVLHAALLVTVRWTGLVASDIGAVFNTTFTGLMTLAGTAVGFYFGEVRGRNSGSRVGDDRESAF